MLVGVVRRVAAELGVVGQDAVGVQAVEHRAVQLQRDVLVQPVVDDPGDLRVVRQPAALGLHQAGHDDDLAFGQVHLAGGRGQVDRRGLLVEPLYHAGQHAERGLVRLHLVGRGEQVALGLAARVRGQVKLRRVPEDLVEGAGREARFLAEHGHGLAEEPQALRVRDRPLPGSSGWSAARTPGTPACACACRKPGSMPFGLELCSAARMDARALATTPSWASVGPEAGRVGVRGDLDQGVALPGPE